MHFCRGQYGSIFNYFVVYVGPKATEFSRITQNNGHPRSLKVTDFGAIRKLIHYTLFVNNTNLHPILYRFPYSVINRDAFLFNALLWGEYSHENVVSRN